jgi:hypothetical protein
MTAELLPTIFAHACEAAYSVFTITSEELLHEHAVRPLL